MGTQVDTIRLVSPTRFLRSFARVLLVLILVSFIAVGAGLAIVETAWGKNQIRGFVVRQANQYLTADLTIGRLGGSLARGLELNDVTLSRNGEAIISIETVEVSYSLRELFHDGTTIRRLRVTRPRVVARKQTDGRWNLGALVKREARQQERTGPGRNIVLQAIDVVDGRVSLRDPLQFGAAHVPTEFRSLNASLSFAYAPVQWTLTFGTLSWEGLVPDLTVTRLSGRMGQRPDGWLFDALSVETPRSAFILNGTVAIGQHPTRLDLSVHADRFSFQEWSGIITGLKNIAVDAVFDTTLKGPLSRLDTRITLAGSAGRVNGQIALDTTVPGWHGAGAVDVVRLNLAHWLNRPDRPSDITGHVAFNLDLDLGRHFPRGTYAFDGPHAMYMDYSADNLRAHGQLTATHVAIEQATAVAYHANAIVANSSIALDEPFSFHFQGTMSALDLRLVPSHIPVPHVESQLAFDYDVSGRFSKPFIAGRATFAPSVFLGTTIGAGMVGTIDTETTPITYTGEGDIQARDLRRIGEGLDVRWLQDPRYAGSLSGRFLIRGAGTTRDTLVLTASGRVSRANLFHGVLSDADVTMGIDHGTLTAGFNGQLAGVDPEITFADGRFSASLTGTADLRVTARDLLSRTTTLADYDITGTVVLSASTIRGIPVDRAAINATLNDERLTFTQAAVSGPAIAGIGSGVLALNQNDTNDFRYNITHADLATLRSITGGTASGLAITSGRLAGPTAALQVVGDGTFTTVDAFGISAATIVGSYDVRLPSDAPASARVTARASFVDVFGQALEDATGTLTLTADRADFDVTLRQAPTRTGQIAGAVAVHRETQKIDLLTLTITLGTTPWRLAPSGVAPTISWSDAGLAVTPAAFVTGANGDERINISGDWRYDGNGVLHVTAAHVPLESLENAQDRPPRYGGGVDLDATIRGTRTSPRGSGTVTVTNGRVERVTYEKLAGRVDYKEGLLAVDFRLDQAPGIWLTAHGTVPPSLFNQRLPERPLDVAFKSSLIDLGLLGGVTDVVDRPSGQLQADVHVSGTSHDPHLDGTVNIANAGFIVTATGVRYKNGRAALQLSSDRITVDSMHVEDSDGRTLDVQGSLGTRQLRAGDLTIDATARRFKVLDNELGKVDVNATLRLRGQLTAPRLAGDLTVNGTTLKVDEILERALFQPYATEQVTATAVDAVVALNPWERLGLDIALHVPETLRLTGNNVQVTPGAPIGLGDINLRVGGDLYLYKDPGEPLSITGSLDSINGTYGFQGRRFTIDETRSSINFVGDLNPNLFVTVTRAISGVEARVTISGSLRQPELHLASSPPLDESDILSLIVFSSTPNDLSASQQQELAVRAGTLAAGFIAAPLLAAVENDLGLEAFQIEPTGEFGGGPRFTIGQELAPGLVARFSRQFGQDQYDEVTVEYYLSRLLRLRATFSDAQSIAMRSAFRRIERAGIDFLVFLSF